MNFKPNSEWLARGTGIVLIAIGAVALYLWRPLPPPEAPPRPARVSRLLDTQCLNHAARVRVVLESEASLLQLAQPLGERELVEMQLNYVRNSVLATQPGITHFSFTADDTRLEVLRREETYTDLPVEFRFSPAMLMPESPRLRQLIAQKELAAGAPQRKLRYRAEAEALICADAPIGGELRLAVPLPRNPETAFWAAPPADWRELRFKAQRLTLNPCADDELADLPQPEFYWYFWNPAARACPEAVGRRLTRAELTLTPHAPEAAPAPALHARTGSLIFGWLDTQYDATAELPAVAAEARRVLRGLSAPGLAAGPWRDPSSGMLLETLAEIRRRAGDELGFRLREREQHLEIRVTLPHERELHVFWGPTDALGKVPPRHYAFLARALGADDVLVYAGHASLGQSLLPRTEHAPADAGTPGRRQLLAFLSCYSVNYLSHHDLKAWTSADQIYLVTTASSMSRFSRAALTLLAPVVSGEALELRDLSPANTWSDDQFVVSELHRPHGLEPLAERITQ